MPQKRTDVHVQGWDAVDALIVVHTGAAMAEVQEQLAGIAGELLAAPLLPPADLRVGVAASTGGGTLAGPILTTSDGPEALAAQLGLGEAGGAEDRGLEAALRAAAGVFRDDVPRAVLFVTNADDVSDVRVSDAVHTLEADIAVVATAPAPRYELAASMALGPVLSTVDAAALSQWLAGRRDAWRLTLAADPSSLEVFVDDVPVDGWTYDPATWVLSLPDVGAGALIEVTYFVSPGDVAPDY